MFPTKPIFKRSWRSRLNWTLSQKISDLVFTSSPKRPVDNIFRATAPKFESKLRMGKAFQFDWSKGKCCFRPMGACHVSSKHIKGSVLRTEIPFPLQKATRKQQCLGGKSKEKTSFIRTSELKFWIPYMAEWREKKAFVSFSSHIYFCSHWYLTQKFGDKEEKQDL